MVAILGIASGVYAGTLALRQRRIGGVVSNEAVAWGLVAERSVWLCFGFVSLAMLSLFHALAHFEFQLRYVAEHTARGMALHYRLAALWGGQAGSLLLWLWMLTAYASACVWFHRRSSRSLMPWVVVALLTNASFFLGLVNFVTNPFTKLPPGEILSDGAGLNPLLQHPVMMIHPLMLYTGFTGFAVPFAFAFAALVTRELGTAWFRTTRRWTLFPWFFLSIGILLGGRWAYEVLGWGGYWAWDPVENASLMPWLAGTAYLHSVMIQEKRDMLKLWNLVLIGLTYSLCLFGTFLTRSGVVSSVHSFTAAGWFGYIFLGYVLAIAGVYFGVVYHRREALRSSHRLESIVSREASFLINNWLFLGILSFVICLTLFPVVSEALLGVKMSVGPAFFNRLIGPLALALLFLTGVGPLIAWRKASLASVRRQFVWPTTAGLLAALCLLVTFRGSIRPYPLMAWTLGAFVIGTVLQEYARAIRARMRNGEGPVVAFASLLRKNQRRYGGYIVHVGVVFIFLGIAGAAFNEERLETLAPGGEIRLHDYRLRYLTAKALPKQHYGGAVARLALYQDDRPLAVMMPERRMYWMEQQPASIPSIHSTLREDLYVILTAVEPDGSATLKVYRNPLVNWIWIGGYTFVLGTLAIMWPHPPRTGESAGA